PLAAGAGRLATELGRSHPGAEVVRMEGFDAPGPTRRPAIGVMTRGSVVTRPAWLGDTLADVLVLPDADAMLGRASLAAAEDTLRLWFAAAGWARRVVLQTREPDHPAVQALVRWDAEGFWEREMPRRAELRFPPAASLVRLSSADPDTAVEVAVALREGLPRGDEVLGPGMDGAVIVKSSDLRGTLDALTPLRHAWAKADRKVRTDVDPLE
ncbi:MAG: primosome assembly protein PriA, partial [Egibacteraceae bacterium]